MCDPVSIIGFGLSAASSIMANRSQQQQASYQNKLAIQQGKNANAATLNSYQQSTLRDIQEQQAAAKDSADNFEATRAAIATARVASGEAGVAGLSVDALTRDLYGQGLENEGVIAQNLRMSQQQSAVDRKGVYAQGKSRTNDAASRMTAGPSPLGLLLEIGGSAAGSYGEHVKNKPPTTNKVRRPTAADLSGPF